MTVMKITIKEETEYSYEKDSGQDGTYTAKRTPSEGGDNIKIGKKKIPSFASASTNKRMASSTRPTLILAPQKNDHDESSAVGHDINNGHNHDDEGARKDGQDRNINQKDNDIRRHLYVDKIPKTYTEHKVRTLFSMYDVTGVSLRQRNTGGLSYAFVSFSTVSAAATAMKEMHHFEVEPGLRINVHIQRSAGPDGCNRGRENDRDRDKDKGGDRDRDGGRDRDR